MVATEHSEVETRFARIRKKLDDGGYLESFGLDSLRLVEHLFDDLVKTTESLQKTLVEYSQYKKVAEELESGVAPFKEENIRLHKENSHLRLSLAKALEDAEDKARDPSLRVRDLTAENNELKLLVSQFAERLKRVEAESFEKTKRLVKLQEKELGPTILVKGEAGKQLSTMPQHRPSMEVDGFVGDACPQCIRLRNFVEYGKNAEKNPKAVDYMKLADSRIDALQLQLRSLKNLEKQHLALIDSLKSRVETRESEIERLRDLIKIRPGRDNNANAVSSHITENMNVNTELKTAEMQLKVLQRRNMDLEEKLKKSILQEHQDFMLGKSFSTYSEGDIARFFLDKELDRYPSHDKMSLLEKLYYLEQQLSHCCKEKALLKKQLDDSKAKQAISGVHAKSYFKVPAAGKTPKRSAHGILRTSSNNVIQQQKSRTTGKSNKGTGNRVNVMHSRKGATVPTNSTNGIDKTGYDSLASEASENEDISIENEEFDNNGHESLGSAEDSEVQDEYQLSDNEENNLVMADSKQKHVNPKFPQSRKLPSHTSTNWDQKSVAATHSRNVKGAGVKSKAVGGISRDTKKIEQAKVKQPQNHERNSEMNRQCESPVSGEYSDSDVDFNGNISEDFDYDDNGNEEAKKESHSESKKSMARGAAGQRLDAYRNSPPKVSKEASRALTSSSKIGKAKTSFGDTSKHRDPKKMINAKGSVKANPINPRQTLLTQKGIKGSNSSTKTPIGRTSSKHVSKAQFKEPIKEEDVYEDDQVDIEDSEFVFDGKRKSPQRSVQTRKREESYSLRGRHSKMPATSISDTRQERDIPQPKGKSSQELKSKLGAAGGAQIPQRRSLDAASSPDDDDDVLDKSATGYYDNEDEEDELVMGTSSTNYPAPLPLSHSRNPRDKVSHAEQQQSTTKRSSPLVQSSSKHGAESNYNMPSKSHLFKDASHQNQKSSGSSSTKSRVPAVGSRGDGSFEMKTTGKGLSAIQEPSLLSISEFEREQSEEEYGSMQGEPSRPSRVYKNNDGRKQYPASRQQDPSLQRNAELELHDHLRDKTSRQAATSSRVQGFPPNTDHLAGESTTHSNTQQMLQRHTSKSFEEPEDQIHRDSENIFDSRRDFVEREYSRGGGDDPPASIGENSVSSYSKNIHEDRNRLPAYMRGTTPSESRFSETRTEGGGKTLATSYKTPSHNNPVYGRIQEERRNVRSVGVNTENRSMELFRTESRDDSLEKKALVDKISALQRKLDEVHGESSRHQLKSFELQGELERTKHMLQVEKQERELAVSELKRVRELNNESTARMLMNSAMGSDGSFRRGATPMELEREIVNLRTALASLDRDKDEMRVELDRKDERLARLTNEASKYMDEISHLQLLLKNSELQISHTGESAKEQTREVEFLKKQLEANRRDLEKTIKERDETLKELHKISGAHVQGQKEKRSVESELELKNKEADDLRRQVQRYIDEVRRIEELLLDKEEEMETLIQHYRSLSVENNNLEAQRTDLEREASSIRESVRDAVGQSMNFKSQLASQNALVQSLEEEIQNLTQQISQLENQLSSKSEKEKMLEADVKASKDLIYRLEIQMDKLKLDMADSESKRKQLEAENSELNDHIAALEARLQEETDRQQELENLVANSREKDFQMERSTLGLSRERDELSEKLTSLQQRSETLNSEVSRYRLKSIELQNELDRTRRQLENEKRERETAITELRRVREQLNSSSANYLLHTALGTTGSSGSQKEGNITDGSFQHGATPSSGSTFRPLAGDVFQRGSSRERSPFAVAHGMSSSSELQLDPPIATSTGRGDGQPVASSSTSFDPSKSADTQPQTPGDDYEYAEYDSSAK